MLTDYALHEWQKLQHCLHRSFNKKEPKMPKVEMYTKAMCPFCVRAKALLKGKDVKFIDIPAAMDRNKRKEMNERSGRNTFPQIFIDGKHVGGCDDLFALENSGKLDALLGL